MQKYTQWPSDSPKKGTMGDPVFDYFAKGQMQFVNNQAEVAIPAGVALLDKIGSPVILLNGLRKAAASASTSPTSVPN